MTNKEKQQSDYEKHPFLETCIDVTTTVLLAATGASLVIGYDYLYTKYHISITAVDVMSFIFKTIAIILITVITIMAIIGAFW